MSELRYCYSCHQKKNISEYTKRSDSHDGLDFYCRECKSDKNSKYYYQQTDEWKNRHKKKLKRKSKHSNKSNKIYILLRKDRFHQFLDLFRSKGCCICGEKSKCCLDFHHLDPKTKKNDISDMSNRNIDKVIEEIKKCVCVCKNCHRKIHSGIIESPPESLLIQPVQPAIAPC
jgi:hypothetical protein